MTPIFTDYETFWDVGYSLTKCTPLEYLSDERFELQTCSTVVGDGEPVFTVGLDDTREYLQSLPMSDAILVSHNGNEFDHMISAWKLGLKPKMWGDTIAMARPHHAKTGLALSKLAKLYSNRFKGDILSTNTKGKRLKEFTPSDFMKMRAYNDDDTLILRDIFRGLARITSAEEMRLIDMTARMILYPQFECDDDLLRRGLKAEKTRKRRQLKKLGDMIGQDTESVTWEDDMKKLCGSVPRFRKILEDIGVEVPLKPSPSNPEKMIPALSKTDQGMEELLNHPNEVVQAAAEARLGVKATQLESRIQRFLDASEMMGGMLPMPLRYAGADTTLRFSGVFKMNPQNLPRIGKKARISDVLRHSLRAPEGYSVVVADLSAIELRINHFLWKEEDTMSRFHADPEADVYKSFAGENLYRVPEADVTGEQRFVGKVAQLQLGYYSGAPKLQDAARIMSGGDVELEFDEAKRIVDTWRGTYTNIVGGWHRLGDALQVMYDEDGMFPIDPWGLCIASKHGIKTPKALLTYPQLHQEFVERFGRMQPQWFYKSSRGKKAVHGGVLDENICQHLAGQVMKDAIINVAKTGVLEHCYSPNLAHQVHDEAIYVVKNKHAERVLETLNDCLRKPPTWWPELVTWSEGSVAECYGKAK